MFRSSAVSEILIIYYFFSPLIGAVVHTKSSKSENFVQPYQSPPPDDFGRANHFSPFEVVFHTVAQNSKNLRTFLGIEPESINLSTINFDTVVGFYHSQPFA